MLTSAYFWHPGRQYHASLEAFLAETRTSAPLTGSAPTDVPSLRSLVEEHNADQMVRSLRALVVKENDIAEDVLKLELPEESVPKAAIRTLGSIHSGNVLTVRSHTVPRRAFNTSTAECVADTWGLATTALQFQT